MKPGTLVAREFDWEWVWMVYFIRPCGIDVWEAHLSPTSDESKTEARRFMSKEKAVNWAKREVMNRRSAIKRGAV